MNGRRKCFTILLGVFVSLAMPGAISASTIYSVAGLFSGTPTAINNFGQVVGVSGQHAVLYSGPNTVQDLGTLGGTSSMALGLNDFGQVVGWAQTASGNMHAFLWTSGSGMQDLGTFGGSSSIAYAINDSGQVVGFSHDSINAAHGFLWTNSGGMQDLHVPLDVGDGFILEGASALDINNSGQVVLKAGYRNSQNNVSDRTFVSSNNGIVEVVGSPGGPNPSLAINSSGEVAGGTAWGSGFTWTQAGGIQDIPNPSYSLSAFDINDSGEVVGWISSGYSSSAFIWTPQDGTVIPTFSDWRIYNAFGINNAGQIVGEGYYRQDPTQAVILTPMNQVPTVPEPSSLTLLSLGVAGLEFARRVVKTIP